MNSKSFVVLALFLLVSSLVSAEEKTQQWGRKVAQNEVKANQIKPLADGGWSAGYSHGGAYASGQHCHHGCCSKSSGWSLGHGGYVTCTCCRTAAEAKAFKQSLENAIKN